MRVDGEIGWDLMVSWTRSIPLKLVQSGQNVYVLWSTGNEIHLVFVRKKKKKGIKDASKKFNLINWNYAISINEDRERMKMRLIFPLMVFQSSDWMTSPRNYGIMYEGVVTRKRASRVINEKYRFFPILKIFQKLENSCLKVTMWP